MHILRRPGPQRGVSRSSRTLGRGCGGRGGARRAIASRTNDAEAYGQVVSFWRPNAGVKSAIRSAGDGVNKPGHRGEREVSRKTIARGMPGDLRCDRGDYARVLCLFRTRGCGRIERPAFPAPSIIEGHCLAKLGRIAPRECGGASGIQRHCERSEAIHLAAQRKNGLLRRFAPRNDGLKTLYVLAV